MVSGRDRRRLNLEQMCVYDIGESVKEQAWREKVPSHGGKRKKSESQKKMCRERMSYIAY